MALLQTDGLAAEQDFGRDEWPSGAPDTAYLDESDPAIREALVRVLDSEMPAALITAADEPLAMRIVCANGAFARMLRCSTRDLLGHSALLLCGARVDWRYLALLPTCAIAPVRTERARTRFDGSVFRCEIRVTAIRDGRAVTHYLLEERPL